MRPILVPPDRVAQIGYAGLMRGKRVVVAGLGNKMVVLLLRFIPHALLLRIVDQRKRDTLGSSQQAS
jgi:short-subunit dehydrogenase